MKDWRGREKEGGREEQRSLYRESAGLIGGATLHRRPGRELAVRGLGGDRLWRPDRLFSAICLRAGCF